MCVQVPHASLTTFILWFVILDISSHWLQTLNAASSGKHHKELNNRFLLLNYYYTDKRFMGPLCVGAELFFIFHFYKITHKDSYNIVFELAYNILLVLVSAKGYINVLQLVSNSLSVVEREEAEAKVESK